LTTLSSQAKIDKGYIAIAIGVLPILISFALGGGKIIM
jgi:hypothetical protein